MNSNSLQKDMTNVAASKLKWAIL